MPETFLPIVHPDGGVRLCWDMWSLVLVLYGMIMVTVDLAGSVPLAQHGIERWALRLAALCWSG